MEIGDTLTLTADVADMLASAGISWKSNNPAVAAVQGSGAACTVTAEAPGAATITASITTDGGATHQATCAITVTEPAVPVSRVEISTAAMLNTVEKNDTLQLEAVVYPTDATNQAVSWSSSNPDVASSRRGWNGHWCRTWKDCHHRENGGRGLYGPPARWSAPASPFPKPA